MRGEGRRPHPARAYRTIGNYLDVLSPFLLDWSQRYMTLRQVTAEDIRDIIVQQDFGSAEQHMVAARRLFKALRQERVIFQDPTAGISIPKVLNPPVALPEERLAGLLDRTDNLAFKTVIVLVAVHGLSMHDIRLLRTDDVLLDRGRLLVHRTSGTRIVYLDELTADLINRWLRERHQRWPSSRNPYLIVSQVTALEEGPVNALYYAPRFRNLGITSSGLRQDRILDEARITADPVHLMQVFGICAATAMKYVNTAHPGRQSTIRF
jgi:integrase